jgi:hypothetical protein
VRPTVRQTAHAAERGLDQALPRLAGVDLLVPDAQRAIDVERRLGPEDAAAVADDGPRRAESPQRREVHQR